MRVDAIEPRVGRLERVNDQDESAQRGLLTPTRRAALDALERELQAYRLQRTG
jgi:hypothetical protein